MRVMRRLVAAVLPFSVLVSVAAPAGAEDGMKLYDRLYLLASGDGFLHWGVDPSDPEMSVAKVVANCPGSVPTQGGGPTCFTSPGGGTPAATNLDVRFMPGSLIDEEITWDAESPLRFHFGLKVSSTFDPVVALVTERGGFPTESSAATEVAPDVWEGVMSKPSRLLHDDRIRLRVRVPNQHHANRTRIEIATGGASWIDLPEPVRAASVPELLRQSPDSPTPLRFDTPLRHFTFNDADYTVGGPYSGDLTAPKRFDLVIPRKAAIVYAWVEAYESPFTHDVLRGEMPDPRKVNDTPMLTLHHDDDVVGASTSEANQQLGRGTNAMAITSLPAGTLSLEVKARPRFSSDLSALESVMAPNHPYKAYILAVHGERTLQSMRWRFEPAISEPFIPAAWPSGNTCVNPSEPVPLTKEATTFSVDLEWDTPTANATRYTIGWSAGGQEFHQCGQLASGDRVRLVNPGERVWAFAPTPVKDTVMAGWRDTIFEMAVRYSYTRPPCPEQGCV